MNLEPLLDKISASAPRSEETYIGPDGLLHCAVCREKCQTRITFLDKEKVVPCICGCEKARREAIKERERLEEVERRRRICFSDSNMASWTFENDDRHNAKISDAMARYCDNFKDFRKDSKGLILYGPCGTGKTYFAACIANRLLDRDYHVLMTDFSSLINQIQGMYEGKQEFIESLNRYTLLIIDDLGVERKTEFAQEIVYNVINSRYKSGLPLIITTNLTGDELKRPQEIGYARIYDRILERCFPVEVTGPSRRRLELKHTYSDVKNILGL